MAQTTRTEVIDGKKITIVEDTREELQDFLRDAQEIESAEGEEQQEKMEKIFGKQEKQSSQAQERELTEEQKAEAEKRKGEIESRAASRANSDVALSMQISDQVAAEAAAQNPCYVVHGAKILCSMGSREARLVVPVDHGIVLKGKPKMVVEDSQALTNVMCFGNCFSTENPNMEQAAIDATNQYNEKKSQTFWGKVKAFFGVKTNEVNSVNEELKAMCICECIPSFSGGMVWQDGNEKSLVDGKNTLIQTGTLICDYGGIIRIIGNGQEG